MQTLSLNKLHEVVSERGVVRLLLVGTDWGVVLSNLLSTFAPSRNGQQPHVVGAPLRECRHSCFPLVARMVPWQYQVLQ